MDIVMPKMGESVSEGTILKWHKQKGDHVNRDEIIFEISTDKVDTEIPSPEEGVLSEIRFNEGDTVEVGTVVAVIETNGEKKEIKKPDKESADSKSKLNEDVEEKKKQSAGIRKEEKGTAIEAAPEPAEKTSKQKVTAPSGNLLDIKMPKMGESVMEGTIIKWHKKAGDKIKKDEVMYEISTDKVDTEVPSPAEGVVAEILVAEQETVEVGTVVAKLSTGDGSIVSSEKEEHKAEAQQIVQQQTVETKQESIEVSKKSKESEPEKTETASNNETSKFLSPLVLNIAKKENVSFDEIDQISGTGLDGRITKKDILTYLEERKSKPEIEEVKEEKVQPVAVQPQTEIHYEPSYSDSEVEKIPMNNIRQKIMQHMINSRDTSVHVSAMIEVDMTKIYVFIKSNKESYLKNEGVKLTYMPFIAAAVVKALKEFPLVNASIEGSTIIKKKFINLGIAVAVEPSGLIVPNIKNADEKNITGLAKSIADLADRARSKRLTPDDITNGTFSITNYGVFGTIFGTPIINQPEVAILGVGTVIKKPVIVETDGTDTIAIKPVMALTLSHDHRLVDGMLGGRFLKFMKETLESFNVNSN